MKKFKFKKIDAFATDRSNGNPAGCVYLDHVNDISEYEMQQIARELKGCVNEVGFVCPIKKDAFHLQFYSSERSVAFCGHAIVGIMFDMLVNDVQLLKEKSVIINTDIGQSVIENHIRSQNSVFVSAPAPEYLNSVISVEETGQALGIETGDINQKHPTEIINAGLNTLIVPIIGLKEVLDMMPDIDKLKRFCVMHRIDIVTVYTPEVFSIENTGRSRVFAPVFGYLEDPATGSGNSALGYYLLKHKLWDGQIISIEQNGFIEKYNIVKLMVKTEQTGQKQVCFGGGAVTRFCGEYRLQG